MIFRLLIMFALTTSLITPSQSAPIEMTFSESTYQPGSPLLLSVILPTGITDLGAYEIQIVITGNTATAGVDYGFDLGATEASSSQYVFDSDDLFFDALLSSSATSQILVLSDLVVDPGVDVTADVNDRVANVVVYTSANYAGPLTFTIDSDALILDTPLGEQVAQIAAIRADTAAASPITLTAIPEPSAIGCAALGLVIARLRRRR